MRGGYLATESSHDTSCCLGSLNYSGIKVSNKRDTAGSSHSQQTYHGACGFKSAVQGCGQRMDQGEFRPMEEISFAVLVSPPNAKRKETAAIRETLNNRTDKNERTFVKHGRNEYET